MKRFRGLFLVIFVIIVITSCATSQINRDDISITIKDPGIYSFNISGEKKESQAVAGSVHIVNEIKLVEETNKISIRKNVQFGLMIEVNKSISNEIEIEKRLYHPTFFDPYLNKTTNLSTTTMKVKNGGQRFWGYKLEEDFEMIPGIWRFEVWYKGQKYAEYEFELQ